VAALTWVHELTVYSEYGQFQVGDRESAFEFHWDLAAFSRHLAAGRDCVSIATTTMYGDVAVRLEAWSAEPSLDSTPFDQVAEASISVGSGQLRVTSVSSDIELGGAVAPGSYRVRTSSQNLSSGAGSDPERPAGDRYLVQLWPGSERPPTTLKQWPHWPDAVPPSST
jgi:hypothetical protein